MQKKGNRPIKKSQIAVYCRVATEQQLLDEDLEKYRKKRRVTDGAQSHCNGDSSKE
mgnify:CR=1 FL=1